MSDWFSSRDGQDLIRGTLPRIAKAIENLTATLESLTEISKLRKDVNKLQAHELIARRVWRADGILYSTYDLARAAFVEDDKQPAEAYVLYDKNDEDMMYELKPVPVWFTKKDSP